MIAVPQFSKLLQKNRVDGVVWTHVSMISPKGKYQLDRKTMETFWKYYKEYISDESRKISLGEKPQQYLPILVDVDLKQCVDDNPVIKEYSEQHISDTIEHYQSVIRSIVVDCRDKDLTCVVLEKESYRITKGGKTYVKNGFHLHFPYVFLRKADHEVHLLPRVKSSLAASKVFEEL